MSDEIYEGRTFTIPAGVAFRAMEALRLAHIYILKDSHPDELPEDFKPHKWTDEIGFAHGTCDTYRELLDACTKSADEQGWDNDSES